MLPLYFAIVLCIVAAFAWWLYRQVRLEQRREELTQWLRGNGNEMFDYEFSRSPLGQRVARFLLGKPPVQPIRIALIENIPDVALFRELTQVVPADAMALCIPAEQVDGQLLETLERCEPVVSFGTVNAIDADEASFKRLSRIRTQLGGLMLTVRRLDDDTLACLVKHKVKVQGLYFEGSDRNWDAVSDQGLRSAAKLSLSHVIAGRSASDAGISAFRDHPELMSISLIGKGYSDAVVEDLATIKSLRAISLVDTSLSSKGIAELVRCCGIDTLTLVRSPIDESVAQALGKKSQFKSLTLDGTLLDRSTASALARIRIPFLDLRGDYGDDLLACFAPLAEHLWNLKLRLPNATDAGLAWLKEATNAHWLTMRDTKVSGSLVPKYRGPRPMTWLTLGGVPFNASMLSEIDRSAEVYHLELEGPHVTDETIAGIQFPCSSLSLRETRFTPTGLVNLERINHSREGIKIDTVRIKVPRGSIPPIAPEEIQSVERETEGRLKVGIEFVAA